MNGLTFHSFPTSFFSLCISTSFTAFVLLYSIVHFVHHSFSFKLDPRFTIIKLHLTPSSVPSYKGFLQVYKVKQNKSERILYYLYPPAEHEYIRNKSGTVLLYVMHSLLLFLEMQFNLESLNRLYERACRYPLMCVSLEKWQPVQGVEWL